MQFCLNFELSRNKTKYYIQIKLNLLVGLYKHFILHACYANRKDWDFSSEVYLKSQYVSYFKIDPCNRPIEKILNVSTVISYQWKKKQNSLNTC